MPDVEDHDAIDPDAPAENHDWRPSREALLKRAAAGGAALGISGLLGLDAQRAEAGALRSEAASPRRGGTLRVSSTTGAAETLDPHNAGTEIDIARGKSLYDRLADFDENMKPYLTLASEIRPNRRGDVWTIRLKKGVVFHNGKPLTADDVIYSYRRILNKRLALSSTAELAPFLTPAGLHKIDDHTLQLKFTRPVGDFVTIAAGRQLNIVPAGFKDVKHPIGTGAFMFQSWTPGSSSTFARNPNWWGGRGRPYVDSLVITPIPDSAARLNALLGNQVDIIGNVDIPLLQTAQTRGMKILSAPSGGWLGFCMATKREPFTDVRVREAFRLIAQRPELIAKVMDNRGVVGNDLFGRLDPMYAGGIPQRRQDINKARALLKAAGKEDLEVTLVTADIYPGMLNSAILFALQAKQAGVTVKLNRVPSSNYWESFYLKVPFFCTFWGTRPLDSQMFQNVDSKAPYNETQWTRPTFDRLIRKAQATVDVKGRRRLWTQAQRILWDQGGYIIWGFPNNLDAFRPNVNGLKPHPYRGLGWSRFENVWLT